MNLTRLKRKLRRLKAKRDGVEDKHKGNERNYTYYGGWDLGHLQGQICVFEDYIDDIETLQLKLEAIARKLEESHTSMDVWTVIEEARNIALTEVCDGNA